MTQHAMTIANQAGAAFRADLNNQTLALVSQSAGASAPSTTYAYQLWADTSTGLLKMRNAANTSWVVWGLLSDLGIQSSSQTVTTATGTADALVGTFVPPPASLMTGAPFWVRAAAANATTTPTFTANSGTLPAKTIVKASGALVPGDIYGAGHWLCLQYDVTADKYILLNPATGVVAATAAKIALLPVAASAAASALTITLAAGVAIDFRSSTLASGAVVSLISTAQSLVVPNGATLGMANGEQARLPILALNNAGTIELAIGNQAGGLNLFGTGVISTTAITAGSGSASVIYSTAARTGVAFQVIGYIDITQTTAGAWVAQPTVVQPGGLAASVLVAGNAKWTNVTGSRSGGVTYKNLTGRELKVSVIGFTSSSVDEWIVNIDGSSVVRGGYAGTTLYSIMSVFFTVPAGSSYALSSSGGGLTTWFES